MWVVTSVGDSDFAVSWLRQVLADEEEGQSRANNVTVALVAKTGVIICPIWTQTLFTFFTEGRFPNTVDGMFSLPPT